MNDSIIKLALSITLLFTTLFPLKTTLNQESEYEASIEVENKNINEPDDKNYLYIEEYRSIIWNDVDMNDNVFPEGPACKIELY